MQIQINGADVKATPAIEETVENEVTHALRHHAEQVTRVEVHLHDENGPKHGKDMRVVMEVRLAGHQPMTVDSHGVDLYAVVKDTASKLERAVKHKLERHDAH